ncbi:MAG: dienelactone hydrolase family protein, partial [Deferrisomatales bacterium]|nr:dienelactone hydrolase family protein [Deferrisomatales bacterium]
MRTLSSLPICLLFLAGSCAFLPQTVRFSGSPPVTGGEPVNLTGILAKPEGNGPFPAIVLLHGAGGINQERDAAWARRLGRWGYVTLQVDSFRPRGVARVVGTPFRVAFLARAQDAHDAKAYLAGLPFVAPGEIGVMGWSHGGITTLYAVDELAGPLHGDGPFRAGVAFYPACRRPLDGLEAPVLILIGEKDDWTPASRCVDNMPAGKTSHEVLLTVYPGAFHDFDWEGLDTYSAGHRVKFDAAAAADAVA